jgi:hypothetical protein
VAPGLGLRHVLSSGKRLSKGLKAAPRKKRRSQLAGIYEALERYENLG